MFTKIECEGNLSGFVGTVESAHVWITGGHSKNTWLMVSSSVSHLAHYMLHCIPLAFRFFFTDKQHATIFCKKCLILGETPNFQKKALQRCNSLSKHWWCSNYIRILSFHLVTRFNRISSTLFFVKCHPSSFVNWFRLNGRHSIILASSESTSACNFFSFSITFKVLLFGAH